MPTGIARRGATADQGAVRGPASAPGSQIERAVTWRISTQRGPDAAVPPPGRPRRHVASWSRRVTTISSPLGSVRPMARLMANVRVVMFCPKTDLGRIGRGRCSRPPLCEPSDSIASLSFARGRSALVVWRSIASRVGRHRLDRRRGTCVPPVRRGRRRGPWSARAPRGGNCEPHDSEGLPRSSRAPGGRRRAADAGLRGRASRRGHEISAVRRDATDSTTRARDETTPGRQSRSQTASFLRLVRRRPRRVSPSIRTRKSGVGRRTAGVEPCPLIIPRRLW